MTRVAAPSRPFSAPAGEREQAADVVPIVPARSWPMTRADAVLLLVVVAGAVLARPLASLFQRPYWLDEMWVASLSRAPLSQYLDLSSSTPLGWLLLVRWVPGGISGVLRIVPFTFAVATVAVAYCFGRFLPWSAREVARLAGLATAFGVALAPAVLVRNDLKQYTADGFFALTILFLVARAEASPTRARRVGLAVVCIVALPFSTTAAFVGAAAFGALVLVSARARRRERWSFVRTGGVVGAAIAAYFVTVVLPHTKPALRVYWTELYLPASPGPMLGEVWHRIAVVAPMAALPGVAFVGLVVVGAVWIARHGRPAVGATVAIVWAEMVVAGVAHRYPFLDLRTSHFLTVLSIATASIGAVAVLHHAARNARPIVAILLASGLVVGYAVNSRGYFHRWGVPREDLPAAIEYVLAHRDANDVVVVSFPSTYGFDVYWPGDDRTVYRADPVSMGFVTRRPDLDGVVYVDGVQLWHTDRAIGDALAQARRRGASRVWVLRSHFYAQEDGSWQRTFREFGIHPRFVRIGEEGLWVFRAPSIGDTSR